MGRKKAKKGHLAIQVWFDDEGKEAGLKWVQKLLTMYSSKDCTMEAPEGERRYSVFTVKIE